MGAVRNRYSWRAGDLATGTILYVVTQLVRFEAKTCSQDLLAYGLHMGLIAGFLTDTIVLVAGA